jgi:hypothetical protein
VDLPPAVANQAGEGKMAEAPSELSADDRRKVRGGQTQGTTQLSTSRKERVVDGGAASSKTTKTSVEPNLGTDNAALGIVESMGDPALEDVGTMPRRKGSAGERPDGEPGDATPLHVAAKSRARVGKMNTPRQG